MSQYPPTPLSFFFFLSSGTGEKKKEYSAVTMLTRNCLSEDKVRNISRGMTCSSARRNSKLPCQLAKHNRTPERHIGMACCANDY